MIAFTETLSREISGDWFMLTGIWNKMDLSIMLGWCQICSWINLHFKQWFRCQLVIKPRSTAQFLFFVFHKSSLPLFMLLSCHPCHHHLPNFLYPPFCYLNVTMTIFCNCYSCCYQVNPSHHHYLASQSDSEMAGSSGYWAECMVLFIVVI